MKYDQLHKKTTSALKCNYFNDGFRILDFLEKFNILETTTFYMPSALLISVSSFLLHQKQKKRND